MATSTVLKFMQKTAEDDKLRQQLESLLGVGDGDISSSAELDPDESAALTGEQAPSVTEFASRWGYQFSKEELVFVIQAFQQHQSGDLSDDQLAKTIGMSADGLEQSSTAFHRLAQYLSKTYLGINIS